MGVIDVIILGLIQGFSEFIPVSSSGHLFLASRILDVDTQDSSINTVIIFLHIGTVLAAIFYYRKTLLEFILSILKKITNPKNLKAQDRFNIKLVFLLIVSTFPIGLSGVVFEKYVAEVYNESTLRPLVFTSAALTILGLYFLFLPSLLPHKRINYKNVKLRHAFIIGVFQIPALLYGISRSGMTISGAEFAGLKRKDALKYSFLLSIPVILGASIYEIILSGNVSLSEIKAEWDMILIGIIASFVSGYAAISFLLSFLKSQSLRFFGFYLIIIGILALVIIPT